MANTSRIGEISIAQVAAALTRAGKSVLLPFGDNKRYDLVFEDEDGRFLRVQCKTGRIQKGVLCFPTCSIPSRSRTGCKTVRKSYGGQAELFGVFCPDNETVYVIPIKDLPPNTAFLRLERTKNNQQRGIRWAKDYEAGKAVGMETLDP